MKLTIDGKIINLKKIGSGTFSKVYQGDDNMVYAFLSTNGNHIDYSKEAVSMFADKDNPHIPQIEVIENERYVAGIGYVNIYRLPKYNKLSGENLKTVNRIISSYKKVLNNSLRRNPYELSIAIIEAIELTTIPNSLKDAIQSIYDSACSYGDSYMLEFAKRNIMQDDNGNIILLDIIFNQEALREVRKRVF